MSLVGYRGTIMTEERFWLLTSLELSGEISPEERVELEQFLADHPAWRLRFNQLQSTWQQRPASSGTRSLSFNKHLQRLSNHLSEDTLQYESADLQAQPEPPVAEEVSLPPAPVRRLYKRMFWVAGIAASLVLGWFFAGPLLLGKDKSVSAAQNTISTKRGSKSKVQLPDGTQVWLNADSRITYNENFQGSLREVQLSGEAYFDVVRDEERPFVIHTNVIDIKVLGTAFNVRSYADEKNTETSLVRGSVEVTLRNHPEKKFTLKPNDKLIINNEQAGPVAESVKKDPERTTSKQIVLTWGKINYPSKADTVATEAMWTRNKLAFDKESLEEIALKIERWYDVKVVIADEAMKKTEFSIIIEDESLQQVMEALRVAGKFHYSINKKEVTIRP
ncbi:MAG: FecR domain-containing protein [Chitinophagaceae bacterium]|nr:FecR domain-containing protein [Chitinophagaceae bacterium]